jgi:transitional endoplasmic reticulum ATPase
MLNLDPIVMDDQPTSYIKIGDSKIDQNTDIVQIKHNNRSGYFRVRTEDDTLVDRIGNDVYINGNLADLFDGIHRGVNKKFLIDPDVDPAQIPECEYVCLYSTANESKVESYLRETNYLLHPIEEIPEQEGIGNITPLDVKPEGWNTVKITQDTEIEFEDQPDNQASSTSLSAQPDNQAEGFGQTGGGAQQAQEESVDVSIEPKKPTVSFEEDVAGLPQVKDAAESLLSLFDPAVRAEVIERYGEEFASRGNSMMLYGPPGCGKTLISEAIAYEAKFNTSIEENYGEVKFLEIKGSDVLSKYSGESEQRVEAIFEKAHEVAQNGFAVLFFDEVDTLIPDRGDESLQRHERSLTNAFLQEMNEIEDNLLVIGATNMPFTIDPAATRRFPTQQFIPQPDKEVMAEVWEKNLSGMDAAEDVDYDKLGAASEGYTPAEIADRVMGSELKKELVESVYDPNKEPIKPDADFFINKLEQEDPKTIRQYIASIRDQIEELEGYPDLRDYVENQADRLDMTVSTNQSSIEQILSANGDTNQDATDSDENSNDE